MFVVSPGHACEAPGNLKQIEILGTMSKKHATYKNSMAIAQAPRKDAETLVVSSALVACSCSPNLPRSADQTVNKPAVLPSDSLQRQSSDRERERERETEKNKIKERKPSKT